MLRFKDRRDAGRQLADALGDYDRREGAIVLGLPRGGVIVAFEVAHALRLPLDVLVVRKLGTPGQEELAMGAIGPRGIRVLNPDVVGPLGIGARQIEAVAEAESMELVRREYAYRGARPPLVLVGRTVILVDDGLATGATMRAAVAVAKAAMALRIVVAVPCSPPETAEEIASEVDELVALARPEFFHAVGEFYVNFDQTTDEEVRNALDANQSSRFEATGTSR